MSQATPLVPPFPQSVQQLTIGQILDRIFRLLRTHILLFLEISTVPTGAFFALFAVIVGALFAIGAFAQPPHTPDPQRMLWVVFPLGFVATVAFILAYAVFEAAANYAAVQANRGVRTSFSEAYRIAFRNAGRFCWLMILRALIISLPISVVMAVVGIVAALSITPGTTAGPRPEVMFLLMPLGMLFYLGSFIYAIVMGLCLSLAPSACVVEGLTATASLKRSFQLTRNAKGRIFIVLLVVYAAGYVALLIFEALCGVMVAVGAVAAIAMHAQLAPPWSYAGIALLAACGAALMFLWMAVMSASYVIAFAVLYHDQRLRNDGIAPVLPAGEPG
jgi:hypothetical protein